MIIAELSKGQWVLLLLGGALLALGVYSLFRGALAARRFAAARVAVVKSVSQVLQEAFSSPGGRVSVEGVVEAAQPLTAPASRVPCAYFRYRVEGLKESRVYNSETGLFDHQKSWEKVFEEERSVPFLLREADGRLPVNPEGAEFLASPTVSNQACRPDGAQLAQRLEGAGDITRALLKKLDFLKQDLGYKGYRESEWVLQTDQPCCVLGEVLRGPEGISLGRGRGPLIISHEGREEVMGGFKSSFTGWLAFGLACAAAGAGLLAWGLLA